MTRHPLSTARRVVGTAAVMLLVGSGPPSASARQADSTGYPVLRAVYAMESPAVGIVFGAVDRSSLWIAFGAPPAMALARGASDGRFGDAWRAGLAVAGATAVFKAMKLAIRRERPFRTVEGIRARTQYVGARSIDRYAFPSGHATLSAALATSLALDHGEWYITVPVFAWAASVGVSRVWLGVHFPGDVLAGWALGGAVAWGVHAARGALTPEGWDDPDRSEGPGARMVIPPVSLRF